MDRATKDRTQVIKGGYLAQHGKTLIDHGYNIVPIAPGKKAPGFDDWQKTRASQAQLARWMDSGLENHGVGILAAHTPAVDIDVLDDELADLLEEWCHENLGRAPVRIGLPPKRLLLYRTDEPFRKITSKTYLNEWQERCRIEILGDGQQFVAFHKHPETHRPYRWTSEESPLNTSADDLPLIEPEKLGGLVRLFESEAEKRGWTLVRGSRINRQPGSAAIDKDDPFAADAQPVNLSQAELQQRLMLVPGAEDYDTWLQIGMALYHQYDGEDIGREMWHEWSESADNYDADALNRKWDTFDISDKGRAPVTARLILQLAKEAAETKAIETAVELRNQFAMAKDRAEWNEAAKITRRAEIDHLSRASLAEIARDRLVALTGNKVPLAEVKKSLAYEINTKELPRWCRDWVYDASEDRFYHTVHKHAVSAQGFNAINDRHAMTKKDVLDGKSAPVSTACHLALNVYKIPTVHGRMYAPGRDGVFIYNGTQWANTYPEHHIPPKPKNIRPIDKINIKRVRAHIAHMLEDPKEQRILLDWLSYVVQNPGKRVNWAILLQGVPGDGKSFFAFLLRAVMGIGNVTMANAHILESSFTAWAQGQCVLAFEEVHMVGHNRYDVLNRFKPLVTNRVIEIHAKGRDPYNVENTTSYLLFSNYRKALPLQDNERRYCVLFSQWQQREKLAEFMEENPDYYNDLYAALDESAPALRQWMLQLEQSPDFHPDGNAPITPAFRYMVRVSQPKELRGIREIIESKEFPDISDDLLNITRLESLTMNDDYDFELPAPKTLNYILENHGFIPIGRVRIGQERYRFYSRNPEKFTWRNAEGDLIPDTEKIRKYMDGEQDDDDEDDDL
ncbi:TPA: DUF5906 domain-containing protein [Pseudomonas aeruginosa]|uniref:DUF5906 domain-containing protein n=1 Tax=Pseudomonas aeruginosa TaxID=287 RepID=UPI0006924F70|nr:DUF5906 domain-containing protein [Pseudomonas aeruginosa]